MVEWSEKYSVHRLDLLHGHFSVVVAWGGDGHGVSCLGHTLKKHFRELDEAKAAGIALAKKLAHQILAGLGE